MSRLADCFGKLNSGKTPLFSEKEMGEIKVIANKYRFDSLREAGEKLTQHQAEIKAVEEALELALTEQKEISDLIYEEQGGKPEGLAAKPNVDEIDTSANRVEKTAKNEHEQSKVERPSVRDTTPEERIASENAESVNDMLDKPTGWKRIEGANNDSVTLISYDGKKAVSFVTADKRSGTASVRMNAEAHAYAIDNPYQAEELPQGELVSKPIFESNPQSKIEDFGEHLAGAKKDLWKSYRKAMSDELPQDASEITLSKHFPEPDYENLIAAGVDIRAIAAVKAMRDAIPVKPRKSYKLRAWADKVKVLREFSNGLISGEFDMGYVLEKMGTVRALQDLRDSIELYAELGYPAFKNAGGYEVSGGWTKYNNETGKPESVTQWAIKNPKGGLRSFASREEAVDALRNELSAEPEGNPSGKSVKLDIYRVTKTGEIIIGKKVGTGKYIDLKGGFSSAKDARQYIADNEAELLKLLEQKKEVRPERRGVNEPRVGKDYRQGEDVTPEKFASEFGWRGVQFGNYVEQSRRSKDLNNAYDALLDMSATIGIPSRAVSLNGTLGLAFGARGSGGRNAAAAHFEPDNIVINLTKREGEGSLGHEWFHALANYFARMRGDNEGDITTAPRQRSKATYDGKLTLDDSVRPEVLEAFDWLVRAIRNSDYYKRSVSLDTRRSKDYWSTTPELTARAFETYLITKAEERGESNDYLANIVSEEAHQVSNEMFGEEPYPYPTKAEAVEINKAFDKLFATLKTKETDKGVALYSQSATQARNPFTVSTFKAALNSAFSHVKDFAGLLEATGKVHFIGRDEIGKHLGEGAAFSYNANMGNDRVPGDNLTNKDAMPGSEDKSAARLRSEANAIEDVLRSKYGKDEYGYRTELWKADPIYAKMSQLRDEATQLDKEHREALANAIEKSQILLDNDGIPILDKTGKAITLGRIVSKDEIMRQLEEDEIESLDSFAFRVIDESYHGVPIVGGMVKNSRIWEQPNPEDYTDYTVFTKDDAGNVSGIEPTMHGLDIAIGKKYAYYPGHFVIVMKGDRSELNEHNIDDGEVALENATVVRVYARKTPAGDLYEINESYAPNSNGADIRYSKDGRILAFVKDGHTYFVADNISSTDDNLAGLVRHEIALHALQLGKTDEEFQKILRQIEVMRTMGNKKVQAARDRVPADTDPDLVLEEQAGYLIEAHPELSIVQKLVARFRALLRSIGKSMPVMHRMQWFRWAEILNENDIIYMAQEVMKRAPETLKEAKDRGAFRAEASEKTRFIEEIGKWFVLPKELKRRGGNLVVGSTPQTLIELGAQQHTVEIDRDTLIKVVREHGDDPKGHGITLDQLKSLPDAIANPIAVFESTPLKGVRRKNGRVVLTEMMDSQGEQIIVSIHLSKEAGRGHVINDISSVHGRPEEEIKRWVDSGLTLYLDDTKEISPSWLTTNRLQLPYVVQASQSLGNTLLLKSELVKSGDAKFSKQQSIPGASQYNTSQGGQSANPASWDAPEKSKLDTFIYTMQDKHVDLKRVTEAIKATGKNIADSVNAYLQEELYHGRAAERTKEFLEKELTPLITMMRLQKVELADLEEYMWMRHAEERNIAMQKRNPTQQEIDARQKEAEQKRDDLKHDADVQEFIRLERELSEAKREADSGNYDESAVEVILQQLAQLRKIKAVREFYAVRDEIRLLRSATPYNGDNTALSGVSTKDARDYLATLPVAKRKVYESLAAKVDAITKGTRQTWIDYKLESPDAVKAMESAYQHYVPLQREDMDHAHGTGIGQGFSIKGNPSKRATGSNRPVVDILANLALAREKAIIRGEKNRVSKALIGLAVLNPNADFWNVNKPPVIRTVNPRTGLVEEYTDPTYKNHDNVVMARDVVNGKVVEYSLMFNEQNERAMRMAQSIKNLDVDSLGEILGNVGAVTRYISSINTQYNPMFGVVNILRDTGSAVLNLTTTPLAGKEGRILKDVPGALLGIYRDVRAHRKGKAPSSPWSALYEEFESEGGKTGYRDQYKNAKERAEVIEKALNPDWWLDTKAGKLISAGGLLSKPESVLAEKAVKPMFDWLSDYNEAMENAVRLAAYKEAKDTGLSKQQAASLAKNLTVNFNRKGKIGREMGALYAFFNASVQGTSRMVETLKGKRGKQIIYGGLVLGALQAVALAMSGFDDDEPPEFVKDRNILIPVGDGKYLSIPLPLGFNYLPIVGRLMAEAAIHGKPMKRATHAIETLFDIFNPVGTSSLLQTVAPSVIDPVAAIYENKDWTGKPIAKEDFNKMHQTPGFTRTKDTATWISRILAEGLNTMSGGSQYRPGLISPTADQLDYLGAQIGGGVWRETSKIWQLGETSVTGDELPTYKIPVLGKFYGDTTDQSSQGQKFYQNLKELNAIEDELKGRRKNRDDVSGFLLDHPEARIVTMANHIEHEVSKLRKRKQELVDKGASKDRIKLIEMQITARMKRLNDRVKQLESAH